MISSRSSRQSVWSRVSRPRRRQRVQLGLECLEDRTNPSPTIVAVTGGDFGNPLIWQDVATQAHRVPTAGDYASSGFPLTASGNYTVASVNFTGQLSILGGSFTVSSASTLLDGNGQPDPNSGSLIVGLTLGSATSLHVTPGISFLAVVNSEISSNIQVDANGSLRFLRGDNNLNPGASLTGPGLFRIEGDVFGGPTVRLNTPITAPANMLLRDGVLTGPNTLTIPTGVTFNWNTVAANIASMTGPGTTVVQPGGTLLIGGANHNVLEDRTISNAGTVTFANAVTFNWGGSAKIDNLGSGTFNIQTDAPINAFPSSTDIPLIANAGTLIKTSPTGTGASYIGPVLNNSGTVRVDSGVLNLARGGTQAGAFMLAAGTSVVLIGGGVTNLNAGTTFSGPGLLSLTGGEMFVNTPVSIPNYAQSDGNVRGTSTLTLAGTADWSAGGMIDAGTTVVPAGATLTLSGQFDKGITTSRVLNNAGTINHIGTGQMVVDSGAVLNNQASGVYNLAADTNLGPQFGAINNAGLFVKSSAAGGNSFITAPFNNTGTLRVDSGMLTFNIFTQTAGSSRVAAGGTLKTLGNNLQLNGGTLVGNGTVGNVSSTGTGAVSPGASPGILTVNGNLILAGPYVVELNGRTPGTQYDRLALNGFVALNGGALNLSMGYTPAAGDGFLILTNDGTDPVGGTFAGLPEGTTMTLGGLTFHITYHGGDGNDVALTSLTTPPPAVAANTINNGAAQRSRVTDVTIAFSQVVTFAGAPSAAFRLTRTGSAGEVTLAVDLSGSTASQTIAKLTFSGALTQFGSLVDGNYTLTVFGNQVSVGGVALDGDGDGTPGGDYTTSLFRFFGDINGDRHVDIADFGLFSNSIFNLANYIAAFDFNNDGHIDIADFGQFSIRIFTLLP